MKLKYLNPIHWIKRWLAHEEKMQEWRMSIKCPHCNFLHRPAQVLWLINKRPSLIDEISYNWGRVRTDYYIVHCLNCAKELKIATESVTHETGIDERSYLWGQKNEN